jgi:hypothetical protein
VELFRGKEKDVKIWSERLTNLRFMGEEGSVIFRDSLAFCSSAFASASRFACDFIPTK